VDNGSPHLHFGLKVDGERVDPLPLLGKLAIDPMETAAGRWLKARWARERREKHDRWRSNRAKQRRRKPAGN